MHTLNMHGQSAASDRPASLNAISDSQQQPQTVSGGYLSQVSLDWEERWRGRGRHVWEKEIKVEKDRGTDRGEEAIEWRELEGGKKAKEERSKWLMAEDKAEGGGGWNKDRHGATCCVWAQFTLQVWVREPARGIQRMKTGSERSQFNSTKTKQGTSIWIQSNGGRCRWGLCWGVSHN